MSDYCYPHGPGCGSAACSQGSRSPVTLVFIRDELLYDIKNIAYVEGDVMPEQSEHRRHQVTDIGEAGNVERVKRMLDLSFAQCVEMCYPYSKRRVEGGETIDDHHLNTHVYCYVMELRVPEGFSSTTLILLKELIHEYMVSSALADWLGITNPEAAANWRAKLVDIASEIEKVKNHRGRAFTRRTNPW